MSPFFWNSMILLCNFGIIDSDKVGNKCVNYMSSCILTTEAQTNGKYIRCQNQWLQLQRSYAGSKHTTGGSINKDLLRKDGHVNGSTD